jgi:pyruvate formate lyase activating enzyme
MQSCKICDKRSIISESLIACSDCVREDRSDILKEIEAHHKVSRERFLLTSELTADAGINCHFCGNACLINEDQKGYCGLRQNKSGRLKSLGGNSDSGILNWSFDPLPTNCCADWICEGSGRRGMYNLAAFYRSCSFNCMYCQNWHFKTTDHNSYPKTTAAEIAAEIDDNTYCICWYGGDPSTQMPNALMASKLALLKKNDIRICFETNGNMNRNYLKQAVKICLKSGGTIKFDLKAYNNNLHKAICGIGNQTTLDNFKFVAESFNNKTDSPLLLACTLMVPGYIDEEEVFQIASFIASLNPDIPYSLLGFYPQFYMKDLPVTSRAQAERCEKAAKRAGLKHIHIGNKHLLS